ERDNHPVLQPWTEKVQNSLRARVQVAVDIREAYLFGRVVWADFRERPIVKPGDDLVRGLRKRADLTELPEIRLRKRHATRLPFRVLVFRIGARWESLK